MTDFKDRKYIILTGNYGSGKTEIALNLSLFFARSGETTLVDLDIVNPYFRSAEKAGEMRAAGIRLLMPTFALTTVDIPALPAEIQSVFEVPSEMTVFDVGGDDTGAAALGRYYPSFMSRREKVFSALVINTMRPMTENAEDITELAGRIAARGRIGFDALINNTNLAHQTEPYMVEEGEDKVLQAAKKMNIHTVYTTGMKNVLERCSLKTPKIIIERKMLPEWMEEN